MVIKLSGTSLDEKFFTKSVIGQNSPAAASVCSLSQILHIALLYLSPILHIAVLYFSNLDCRRNSSWGMLESSTFVWPGGTTLLPRTGVNFLTFLSSKNIRASVCYLCDGVILIVAVHQSCDVGIRYTLLPLYLRDGGHLRDGGQFRSILWIPICSLSHLLPFPTFLLLKGNTLGSISAIDPASCVLLAMPPLIKTIQHMNHLKTLAPSLSLTSLSICSSLPKPAPQLRLDDAA